MSESAPGPMAGRLQPAREDVATDPRLSVVDHPLVEDLLAVVRDRRSDTSRFGGALERLAMFLLWEAARDLPRVATTVPGFDGTPVDVNRIAPPAAVAVMRAGSAFSTPFRTLFPNAALFHLGVSRDERTLGHRLYSDNFSLPSPDLRDVWILDPMLATGGSILVALERVRAAFRGAVTVVCVVAAPVGVDAVLAADPALRIVTAALDERLNEQGYILPGLGDAGDRLFGTGE